METDQSPEVPEAVAETQAVEPETPAPEPEGTSPEPETPAPEAPKLQDEGETASQPAESQQAPPEPEKLPANTSDPDMKSTEKAKEVEPATIQDTNDATVEPVKSTEKVDVTASEVQETSAEKKVEVDKPVEAEKNQEIKVEQQVTEQQKPEKESESTQNAAAAAPTETPATETELEKPEDVQAEVVKEVESKPKEPELPLFFGWFLLTEVEERIRCSTMDFLKTLDTLEAFKKHLSEFTGEAEKEVDLEQYFQPQGPLHCTTMFCDYGKVEGSKEYAEQQVVKDSTGSAAELSVVGLMVTPRTFGGRVALTPEQLQLWPEGADKAGIPPASLPSVESLLPGSRAHVTLGCASGVEAVQTGLDLLEILALQQSGQEAVVATEELELGTLSYLGKGRWYLALREAVACDTTFSSFSEDKPPTEPASKKEGGEKKKKLKCSIL